MFENYLLVIPLVAYTIAQIIKTCIDILTQKKLNLKRLIGAGGMPSSHSAVVVSLAVATIKQYGITSPLSAIVLVFAAIVLYDAVGVRQEVGKHAQSLNRLLAKIKMQEDSITVLNEMVGHTFVQVIAGALLGGITAITIPIF